LGIADCGLKEKQRGHAFNFSSSAIAHSQSQTACHIKS
jgi:hypothetical protein